MASNNQVDASNTPLAYNQNLRDIWDGRSHTTPEEQVAIKEARFTALFNAAHNLDTAQIRLQDEYPIPKFTAFTQGFHFGGEMAGKMYALMRSPTLPAYPQSKLPLTWPGNSLAKV
ncbi:hypothetical protein BDZ97DRAFT_1926523 [Flammula alnicola]|nr:hypothetical protein BDZ97DRAFT_1926523 [Flammula alnicola]